MKSARPLVALLTAMVAATSFATLAHSATPQAWHNPSDLNIAGVRLGMGEAQARQLEKATPPMYFAPSGLQADRHHRVNFVFGTQLCEGTRVIATSNLGYTAAVQLLGEPFASGHEADNDAARISYYRAGSHWVMVHYTVPSMFSRAASVPSFGLATDANAIPTVGWGREVLNQGLSSR